MHKIGKIIIQFKYMCETVRIINVAKNICNTYYFEDKFHSLRERVSVFQNESEVSNYAMIISCVFTEFLLIIFKRGWKRNLLGTGKHQMIKFKSRSTIMTGNSPKSVKYLR